MKTPQRTAKEIANIVSVIDAALQLAVLSDIVYANLEVDEYYGHHAKRAWPGKVTHAKRLLLSIALGVLEVWLHFILVGS